MTSFESTPPPSDRDTKELNGVTCQCRQASKARRYPYRRTLVAFHTKRSTLELRPLATNPFVPILQRHESILTLAHTAALDAWM